MTQLTPYTFPCRAIIAPSFDLRQRIEITSQTEEEMLQAQRSRYEIIRVIEK